MSWFEQTITEFGHSLGLNGLAPNEQGVVSLTFESIGTLFIERVEETALIYLARDLDFPDASTYARALTLCHWTQNRVYAASPALRHEKQLLFSVRLPAADFTLPAFQRVLESLDRLHTEVREGALP